MWLVRYFLAPLGISFLLGSCALPVYIKHYRVPERLGAERLGALKKIYVVALTPAAAKKNIVLGKGLGKFLKSAADSHPEENPAELGAYWKPNECLELGLAAARAVSGPFGGAIAVSALRQETTPAWISHLDASSSLWIYPEPLMVAKTSKTIDIRDKTGKVAGQQILWTAKKEWKVKYRLYAEPSHELILEAPFEINGSETPQTEPALYDYLDHQKSMLIKAWAQSLIADLLPHEVQRQRALYKGKTPGMREAYQLAKQNHWDEAQRLWQQEAPGPLTRFNLAVNFERRGQYREAQEIYANLANHGGKTARSAAQALKELAMLMPSSPENAAPPPKKEAMNIFTERWAVLPPANETVDLDGPPHVRSVLQTRLAAAGLTLVPADELDGEIKTLGITDGGQLNSVKPQELGRLLKASYLLYATLNEYKTIPLGIYHKKEVAVSLRAVYAPTGRTLGQFTEKIIEQETTPKGKALEALAIQLAGRQLNKMLKTYLKEEVEELVNQLAAGLPNKP